MVEDAPGVGCMAPPSITIFPFTITVERPSRNTSVGGNHCRGVAEDSPQIFLDHCVKDAPSSCPVRRSTLRDVDKYKHAAELMNGPKGSIASQFYTLCQPVGVSPVGRACCRGVVGRDWPGRPA